jgi:hypothetical protein
MRRNALFHKVLPVLTKYLLKILSKNLPVFLPGRLCAALRIHPAFSYQTDLPESLQCVPAGLFFV